MHILFFAVRNHHHQYFTSLSAKANYKSSVYRTKDIRQAELGILLSPPAKELKEITDLKVKEIAQKGTSPLLSKALFPLFFIIAIWKYACFYKLLSNIKGSHLAMWGGPMFNQSIARLAATNLGYALLFFENGHLPNTTVVDSKGVNYLNSLPRDTDFYLNYDKSASIKLPLTERKSKRKTKQDLGETPLEHFIFAPFQVDADRQILVHSPWIKNMRMFFHQLTLCTQHLPENWCFVIKEHPSSSNVYHDLHKQAKDNPKIKFVNASTQELIEKSQAVITVNSTVGLEAIMLEKPTITLGDCFYAIEGLAYRAHNITELIKAVQGATSLTLNILLKNKFLNYIQNEYLVSGDWKAANTDHLQTMNRKLEHLAANP